LYETYLNVYRIELLSAYIPFVAGLTERYVVLAEESCRYGIAQPEMAANLPLGALAVIPLVQNDPFGAGTWWRADALDRRECVFTQPLPELRSLDISFWIWGGSGLAPPLPYPYPSSQPYPLANEPLPGATAPENNVVLVFRVECGNRK